MSDKTAIEWTDATWNPIHPAERVGPGNYCERVSPGCAHCYASRLTVRYGGEGYPADPGGSQSAERDFHRRPSMMLDEKILMQPTQWKRPRKIFVCSMTDLFGEWVDDAWLDCLFSVMALAPQHTFQVLTKRPERMREYLSRPDRSFPLPNVWAIVSVEYQRQALERIPVLLLTPAAVRGVSIEPMLGPINLARVPDVMDNISDLPPQPADFNEPPRSGRWMQITEFSPGLDWVIAGGESGGPPERRLVERHFGCAVELHDERCIGNGTEDRSQWRVKAGALSWVRSLRDQCNAAGVPFMFKQWGGPTPKSGGRLLDGRTWDDYPIGMSDG